MINLLSCIYQKYLDLSFEQFTDKAILALSVFELISKNDEIIEVRDKVVWLIENTHPDVMVSLFKLDRRVDPTKGNISEAQKLFVMIKNNYTQEQKNNGEHRIRLKEDQIQYYLCGCIMRINNLLTKVLKDYNLTLKVSSSG